MAELDDENERDECEDVCNENAACFGYDWENKVITGSTSRCWLQLAEDFADSAASAADIDQYRRVCDDGG